MLSFRSYIQNISSPTSVASIFIVKHQDFILIEKKYDNDEPFDTDCICSPERIS